MQISLRSGAGKTIGRAPSTRPLFGLLGVTFLLFFLTAHSNLASAAGWRDAPVIPMLSKAEKQRLLFDIDSGKRKGMDPAIFAKVGDSNTAGRRNLFGLGCRQSVGMPADLRATYRKYLARPLANPRAIPECRLGNSFSRVPMSAQSGTLSDWSAQTSAKLSLYPGVFWSPPPGCTPERSPLQCEIDAIRPRYALVMAGTNDVGYYLTAGQAPAAFVERGMELIVNQARQRGVVPVLSTIPPIQTVLDPGAQAAFDLNVSLVNERIWKLAKRQKVPMINLWRALNEPAMINQGMSDDGLHLRIYPGSPPVPEAQLGDLIFANSVNFTAPALRYGANRRNMVLLRTLARLDSIVNRAGR